MTAAPNLPNADPIALAVEQAENVLAQAARVPLPIPDLDTAQRVVVLVKMLRAMGDRASEASDAAAADLKARIDAIYERVEPTAGKLCDTARSLADAVHVFRVANELPRITSDFGPKAYAKAGRSELIVDPALLPMRFFAPDEKAIRAALKAGEAIPGVTETPTEITVIT